MNIINGFQGKYRFLSNFWIEPDRTHVEGEYQQAKCDLPSDMLKFKGLTPGQAKRLGRRIKIKSSWKQEKLNIMFSLVLQKFSEHSSLKKALLETGNAELVEDNTWGDTFWGVCNGVGQNNLGKILMKVREKLRQ